MSVTIVVRKMEEVVDGEINESGVEEDEDIEENESDKSGIEENESDKIGVEGSEDMVLKARWIRSDAEAERWKKHSLIWKERPTN